MKHLINIRSYHGSAAIVGNKENPFNLNYISNEGNNQYGPGIYFSNSREVGECHGSGSIVEADLVFRRSLDQLTLDEFGDELVADMIELALNDLECIGALEARVADWDLRSRDELFDKLKEVVLFEDDPETRFQALWWDVYQDNPKALLERLSERHQIDGLVFKDAGGVGIDFHLVFNPDAIQVLDVEITNPNLLKTSKCRKNRESELTP